MDDLKGIERIILRTPDDSESGLFSKYNLFIFKKGEKPEIRSFDEDELNSCRELINEILKSKGYTEDNIENAFNKAKEDSFATEYDPIVEKEQDDFVLAYLSKKIENPNIAIADNVINAIMAGKISDSEKKAEDEESEEDLVEEENKKTPKYKRVLAGAAAAGILASAAVPIISNVAKSDDAKKDLENDNKLNSIDYSEESIEQLLSRLEDGSFAKNEYTKVLNFCRNFNSAAAKEGNFRLTEDKDNYLTISAEEALYTSAVLNNYSADELMQIFGTKTLDYNKVLDAYNSVCEKIKVYNMNAKLPSGIEGLMNKPDLYYASENSVLAFNKNNSDELSDQVILTYKNNFVNYGVDKNSTPGVAYISTMPIEGFKDANVNNSNILKYKGSFNEKGIENGESISDINKEVSKNNYQKMITESLKSNISEYNTKIATKLSASKNELVEALKNAGEDDLAAKVESRTDISSLEDEIEKNGADFLDLYNNYQKVVNGINSSAIPVDYFIEAIDKATLTNSKCDLNKLKENRIKPTLEKSKTSEPEVVTSSDENYDNSDSDYSSVDYTSTDDNEEIEIVDDNSDSENEDIVEDEVEEVIEEDEEAIDQTQEGYDSVEDYVNTPGAYKYDKDLKNEYMDEAFTEEEKNQMTPSQIWKEMMKAGIELPEFETDEQIQQAFNNSSDGKDITFKDAWESKIKEELANSYYNGQEELANIQQMHEQSEEQVNELNNNEQATQVDTTDNVEEENTEYEEETDYNDLSYTIDYYDYDGIDDAEFEDERTYSDNSTEDISYAEDGSGMAAVVDDGGYTMVK